MKFTHDDHFGRGVIENDLQIYRGYEKKKIYAWVKSDGTLVGAPDDDFKRISTLKEQVKEQNPNFVLRLVEFKSREVKDRIVPPPPPDRPKFVGGCAIGGFEPYTIEHIERYFKEIFAKQYPVQVKTWIEDNIFYVEYKGVRCWVILSDEDLGMDVNYNIKKKWRSYITMTESWTQEYHNVHLGDFFSGTDAVEIAFLAFVKYQIENQYVDDYF